MNPNEILKSIADLEKNLNEIDSAKKQVLKILESSSQLADVVSSYQTTFQGLTENIQQMIDKIKGLNLNILSDLQKHTDNFRLEVSKLNEFTQSIASIRQGLDAIQSSSDAYRSEFTQYLSSIRENLEAAQNLSVTNKNTIISKLDEVTVDLRTSIQSIRDENESKFSELKEAINVNRIIQLLGVVVTIAAIAGLLWLNLLGKLQ